MDWCKQPDRGLPRPDLVLFLDMPVADAARRGGFGDERYEKLDFQQLVRDNFLKLKEKDWKVFRQHVIFVSSATALFEIFICVSIATV